MNMPLDRQAIVLRATEQPLPGVGMPTANQRYRYPTLSLENRPLGPLPADHVRIQMLYAGICGTDVHLAGADPASGYVQSSAPADIPPDGRVMGHEGVGRIVDCGEAVTAFRPGDTVSFASIRACLQCETCRGGAPNQCPDAKLLGAEIDGVFASVADIPASLALDVSSITTDESGVHAAACLEPAGCALLACENARIRPADRVLVLGGGPIGCYAAIIAKRALGAREVILAEPVAARRQLVESWCDAVAHPAEIDRHIAAGVDVVLECSGALEGLRAVFRRIRAGGRVVLLGREGQPLVLDAVDHMITNAISVSGSRGHLGGPLHRILALHRDGVLPLTAPVTRILPSLADALEVLAQPDWQRDCKLLVKLF